MRPFRMPGMPGKFVRSVASIMLAVIAGLMVAAAWAGDTATLEPAVAVEPSPLAAVDPIRALQASAEETGAASWGHWGPQHERYVSW